jgi:sodium/potassium-transporting ATPase subunit alpha
MANVFACRSANISIMTLGIVSNKLVLAGIATEIILAAFIIYTPLGNALFACAPIGINVWLMLIPFALLLLASDETRKFFVKRSTLTSSH